MVERGVEVLAKRIVTNNRSSQKLPVTGCEHCLYRLQIPCICGLVRLVEMQVVYTLMLMLQYCQ